MSRYLYEFGGGLFGGRCGVWRIVLKIDDGTDGCGWGSIAREDGCAGGDAGPVNTNAGAQLGVVRDGTVAGDGSERHT